MDTLTIIIVLIGGFMAGVINTLAGNGSAITLTILTELLGLPPNVANGTNRLGVFTQSSVGTAIFYKKGFINFKDQKWPILIMLFGAIIGVALAVTIDNEDFKFIFKILLVVMLVIIFVKPKRWITPSNIQKINQPLFLFLLFCLGIYGGFIQMGMGIFFLAITVLIGGYDIMKANALKVTVVAVYTLVVLAIFQYRGLIDWKIGALLASGQTLGAYLTAKWATQYPGANIWAYRLLVTIVLLAIIKVFIGFDVVISLFHNVI